MSVYLYDESLLQKLKYWTEKTDIHVYSVDETDRLFRTIADNEDDAPIKLPLLCIRRIGGYTISNPNKKPMSFDGLMLEGDMETGQTTNLNAIPISINYQLDVYTRYLREADSYMRNLVFNFINYPTLQVVIPYNGLKIEHNANIIISNNIEDNSTIPEKRLDQYSRMSINLMIDDAYLWDTRIRSIVSLDADGLKLEIKDRDSFIIEQV